MTGLTALELKIEGVDPISAAPIIEIKELRTLKASSDLLINQYNQFIFGTQNQLTKLDVLKDWPFSASSITLQVTPTPFAISKRYSLAVDLSTHLESALPDI